MSPESLQKFGDGHIVWEHFIFIAVYNECDGVFDVSFFTFITFEFFNTHIEDDIRSIIIKMLFIFIFFF